MDTLIILCLLGDPTLPAVSVKNTGGFQVDIQELLEKINNPDCNIHVVTNTSSYTNELTEEYDNYIIHRIPFEDNWLSSQNELMNNFNQIKRYFFELYENISTQNTLLHSFYWLSGILAYETAQKYDVKYVHSTVSLALGKILSGSKPYYDNQLDWEKKFLANASTVFSITDTEKEQLISDYHIPVQKVVVVGRGVHLAFENPCRTRDGYPTNLEYVKPVELKKYKWWMQGAFTYVGRIQEIKGLHYIILSWLNLYEKYKQDTPPLWICGGTPENIADFRNYLSKHVNMDQIIACEKQQKIVWWGYLDFAGISALFLKTKVLVTHSLYEPGGRVLLEAMAASLPVIATPNGFAKDLIKDGINGYLVNYGDTNTLSERMEHFIKDVHISEQLGMEAKLTYLEQKELWKCYRKHFHAYVEYGLSSFAPH